MYCPACGAANVDGAKFCGACGARLEAPAPVAPVAVAPTTADTAATVVRPPLVDDASLMPRSRGRGRVVAVVAIDLALVIGGLVLWTRSPTTAPASPRTGGAGAVATVRRRRARCRRGRGQRRAPWRRGRQRQRATGWRQLGWRQLGRWRRWR
jgi:hypothetical protein